MEPNHMRARLLGATALVLIAGSAVAQQTDLGTLDLGDSKRDVQTDSTAPVTEVDREEIEDRQASTIAELIDSVPGVTLINGATPSGSGINIRGFGANGTYGTDHKVLIQVDGASVGSEELYRIGTQLYTDPDLYKTVAVSRGTVGSFEYGSGAIGGVVRLETIDAADLTGGAGFAARQSLQYATNGNGKVSSTTLAFSGDGGFDLLANYTLRQQDEQQDGTGTAIGNSAYELPSYLLKAGLTFGNDQQHRLELSYTDTSASDRDVPYDTFQTTGGAFGNVDRDIDTKTTALTYNYNPASDLVKVDVTLSYADQEIIQTPVSGQTGFLFSTVDADHRYETTKLTVKNSMLFDTGAISHDLRVGAELIQKDRLDASAAPGGTDDRKALFIVDDMRIGNWELTPALRYETSDIQGNGTNNGAYSNDALMGGLSARYNFDNGVSFFASAAYTESLPILDDLADPVRMQQTEKATTYELGFAYDSGAGFATKVTGYKTQIKDLTSAFSLSSTSAETVDRTGLEIELSYAAQNGFYVDLNGSRSSASAVTYGGTTQDWANNPADSLQVTLGKKFANGWDLSYEVVANKSRTINGTTNPGWGVSNLRATYKPQTGGLLEGSEIRIGIENLFDKEYTPALATRTAPGRNIKLTLAKTF